MCALLCLQLEWKNWLVGVDNVLYPTKEEKANIYILMRLLVNSSRGSGLVLDGRSYNLKSVSLIRRTITSFRVKRASALY